MVRRFCVCDPIKIESYAKRLDGVLELRVLNPLEQLQDLGVVRNGLTLFLEDVKHLLHPVKEGVKRERPLTFVM